MLAPPPLPSDSLLMALALDSLCLEASRLLSPPLPRIVVRGPRLTLCTVGQPLYLVNGSVAVSGYQWSSGPSGSALWYCTISWEHCSVRSASSKNCDLASVAFPRTSCYWVYPSLLLLPVSSCGSVTAKRSFMWHRPATPSSGSLFPSDRLVSSAVVAYAVVGVGCKGFRPTTSAPHRAYTLHGPVSGGPTVSSSFLPHLKVARLRISRWGYC